MFLAGLLVLCLLSTCCALSSTHTRSHHHQDGNVASSINTLRNHLQIPNQHQQKEEWREYCPGCHRPLSQCLCEHLPPNKISLETQVLVLQHPTEFRRKTISTVPVLKLVLEHCQVLVGRSFDDPLESIIGDASSRGRIPLLLFPGHDAVTLEDPDAIERLELAHYGGSNIEKHPGSLAVSSKYLLILVDGTWTQAKRMLRNSPILLDKCHAIQFTGTSDRSIYDSIRKQPDSFCLSTLESCVRTLKLLEPNNPKMEEAEHHLLDSLKALILTQMNYEQLSWKENPRFIRDASKLDAKKKRQQQLSVMNASRSNKETEKLSDSQMLSENLFNGYKLRPLKGQSDAKYVDSRWMYRSNKSLIMIEKQINADNKNATKTKCNTCLGIEYNNNLVACIIRHRNGSLGILHVDEQHRRRGLGAILLKEATRATRCRNEPIFAFIVDGNKASEALFTKLGWAKADPLGKKGTGKRRAKRLWKYDPSIDEEV